MADYEAFSLNLALRWTAKPASVWAGESWQTHLRLLVGGPNPYPLDSGRVEPDGFGVSDASTQRTVDVWAVSQGWVGNSGFGSVTVTDNDINSILSVTKTWLLATKAWLVSEYELESVRIYPMLKGGGSPFRPGVSATAPIIAIPTGTTLDPASANAMPPDAALAISLGTGTRGPSGRGRMFLGGLTSQANSTTGLIVTAANTALGDATEAMLEGFRAIDSGGIGPARFTPVIYTSRPNKNGSNADTGSVINRVRIGDEWDTQRRRDRQRTDVYTDYVLE